MKLALTLLIIFISGCQVQAVPEKVQVRELTIQDIQAIRQAELAERGNR